MATTTVGVTEADTSNLQSYPLTTFTPAADDLLVLFCAYTASVEPGATFAATDDQSGTYTRIDTALYESAHSLVALVRDQLVASSVSYGITTTCTGDPANGANVVAYRIAGMTNVGAAAIRQSAKQENQASGGTPAPAFASAALTGNVTLGAVAGQLNPPAITPPTSWTEGADIGYGTPLGGMESVYRDSGFTGTTVTWGSTMGAAFASMIVELDTSAPATDRVVDRSVMVTPAVHQAARL